MAKLCTYEENDTFDMQLCQMSPALNVAICVGMWLITVPPLFVAAHLLEKYVDRPVTAFGKIVDEKLLNGFIKEKEVSKQAEGEYLLKSMELEEAELGELR